MPLRDSHLAAHMVSAANSCTAQRRRCHRWHPDEASRSGVRNELGLKDEFLWFAAGRLEPVKNYPALLKTLAKLPGNARLVIAGCGPLLGELRALAPVWESRNASSSLVLSLISAAGCRLRMDSFSLPRWEGMPMAVLEAAACACPRLPPTCPARVRQSSMDRQDFLPRREASMRWRTQWTA